MASRSGVWTAFDCAHEASAPRLLRSTIDSARHGFAERSLDFLFSYGELEPPDRVFRLGSRGEKCFYSGEVGLQRSDFDFCVLKHCRHPTGLKVPLEAFRSLLRRLNSEESESLPSRDRPHAGAREVRMSYGYRLQRVVAARVPRVLN